MIYLFCRYLVVFQGSVEVWDLWNHWHPGEQCLPGVKEDGGARGGAWKGKAKGKIIKDYMIKIVKVTLQS